MSVQTREPEENILELEKRNITFPMSPLVMTEEKVKELLEGLNENKSAGPDLSPKILRPLADVL